MEKYKVLVIEDDEITREKLAKIVLKEGFEPLVAENGRVGLEIFNKENPEVVITDIRMPDIDGLEVLHRLRHISPNAQVILVTAYGEMDTTIFAIREGALDYIKKPIDLDQLILALGRAREKINEYKKKLVFPTILLAEDDRETRERLSGVLEKEGWRVFGVTDGQAAMDIFQKEKIDIALLDIRMPKKDGLEVLHEMRGITNDFEVIVFTGYGDEAGAIQALRNGAMNFIKKPIDVDQFILSTQKAIEKLNTDRALKYRTRELELAKQIIAKITAEKEIIVDLRNHTRKAALDFARELLDTIPLGLVVVDKDMKIRYINRNITSAIGYTPVMVNQEFVNSLDKMGIRELTCDSLISSINNVFGAPLGKVERITTGKYSYLTLVLMSILTDGGKEEGVLMTIRGERK